MLPDRLVTELPLRYFDADSAINDYKINDYKKIARLTEPVVSLHYLRGFLSA